MDGFIRGPTSCLLKSPGPRCKDKNNCRKKKFDEIDEHAIILIDTLKFFANLQLTKCFAVPFQTKRYRHLFNTIIIKIKF